METEEIACRKCGEAMLPVSDSVHRLFDVVTIEYICPNCLHVEKRTYFVARKERWQ